MLPHDFRGAVAVRQHDFRNSTLLAFDLSNLLAASCRLNDTGPLQLLQRELAAVLVDQSVLVQLEDEAKQRLVAAIQRLQLARALLE